MIIFFLVIFVGHLAAAADPYHISINCGGDARGGRNWLREGSSTVSTGLITARISRSKFSYSLKLSSGPKIIRLHFQPPSYIGFERSNDLFSVVAGNSSLLANFSASVAASALAVNVVVKQFCVTVEENQTLNLVFSPDWGNSSAFVNEIEIISIPSTTPPYCSGVVAPKPSIHVDNSTALERVHYQHVKWGPISSGDDIDSMFGMWSKQPSVGEHSKMRTNKTWRVSIDARFKYLVRLHLCEAGLHMDFVLLINGRVALTSADMHQQRRGNRELFWYNNYMVVDEELKQGDISISLHSRHKFLDRHGPLEGFEVFKIISHQSASLLTLLHSLAYSILFYICCIVFIVYLEHKLSQYKSTREDNKPLARAKQLSHHFSLARILRICGYGGVGKGFLGRLSHPNLLKLLGHRWDDNELLLVYKYMSKGSLENHLFRSRRVTWYAGTNIQSEKVRNSCWYSVLGEGGFGSVYKGWIHEKSSAKEGSGVSVAIKKSNHQCTQGFQEGQSGVKFLGRLSHPNLVKLFGYGWDDNDLLLVYEFVSKGSFENHPFKSYVYVKSDVYVFGVLLLKVLTGLQAIVQRRGGEQQNVVVCMLGPLCNPRKIINSWLLMIFGENRAMHAVQVPVICRDFKASNILLDDVKLGVPVDFSTGSHLWQIDRRSIDTAVIKQPSITATPTPAKKQVQEVQQTERNKAHVPAQAPAHSDCSKQKRDVEIEVEWSGVEIINNILLSIV